MGLVWRERERERRGIKMYFATIYLTSPAYCDSFAVWEMGPPERKGKIKISLHKKGKSELVSTNHLF